MFGVPHITNLWVAEGGFQYWTDATSGKDVALVDGGAVLWNFAPFNVAPQDPSIFDLPSDSNTCNTKCSFATDMKPSPMFALMEW